MQIVSIRVATVKRGQGVSCKLIHAPSQDSEQSAYTRSLLNFFCRQYVRMLNPKCQSLLSGDNNNSNSNNNNNNNNNKTKTISSAEINTQYAKRQLFRDHISDDKCRLLLF